MKKYIGAFLHRGLTACGFGPVVLAILYLVLHHCGAIDTLTVDQVCIGIFSVSALAFVAGGMNIIYQIERLPLMVAILIHGGVLYISYLITYLLNDWLKLGVTPVLIFSGIFILGYVLIWAIIYTVTKRNASRLNQMLNQQRSDRAI